MALRKYEAMFIFPESLNEEALAQELTKVQEEITRLGGRVESVNNLGRRPFARRLKKKTAGYYALIVFDFDPARLTALQARYRIDENVFRVQIVRAPEEGAGQVTLPVEVGETGE